MTASQLNALARLIRGNDGSAAHSHQIASAISQLERRAAPTSAVLRRYHSLLLFLSAFGRAAATVRAARAALKRFEQRTSALTPRQRAMLIDTGIIGARTQYTFGYESLRTIAQRWPGECEIDWSGYDEPERLDGLLYRIALNAEQQTLDDGNVSTQEWIDHARGRRGGTAVDWLVREVEARGRDRDAAIALFEDAEVPVVWNLHRSTGSTTLLRLPGREKPAGRGPFRRPGDAGPLIADPLHIPPPLPRAQAAQVRAVTVAALAARGREVHAMRFANLDEIYLIDLGESVLLAVLGVVPEQRLPLEGNYGYMLFAGGVPVGYGGVSPLFAQGNTGINIFEEFRGSEAAMLFALTLRAFHSLFDISHFIASPYQFGDDNDEAIESGAFWFYYRLGFRPASRAIRTLAAREWRRLKANPSHRTTPRNLQRLARSDLVLSLPGRAADELFAESNLGRLATAVGKAIAERGPRDRVAVAEEMAARVAGRLGITKRHLVDRHRRESLRRMAPILSLLGPAVARWSAAERAALRTIALGKCDGSERGYVQAMARHARFRRALDRELNR
ncbi:MAG: hypothetical protein IT430_18255 [Phycisphaerales bacterium]|nr:hypothetical protein [Phycisphaerales bacterium]